MKLERNVVFVVAYDGYRYCGFQTQQGLPTVQETITKAIEKITNTAITIHASGRTDAGVHAHGQVIHFKTNRNLSEIRWPLAVNSLLPDDIRIRRAYFVSDQFHSRVSALKKTYRYSVNTANVSNVLLRHMQYHFPRKLDYETMLHAAQALVGTHDFRGFCVSKSQKENNVRTIFELNIFRNDEELLFEITGNGFLHNMVRIIVGTILSLGERKITFEQVTRMLSHGERPSIVTTVPAHGLQLWSVTYDEFSSS